MNLHDSLADWSSWWWPLVVAHLWQSTLFLAVVFLAVLILRRGSAAARHRAWLIGSLKFALPALLLATPLRWLGIRGPAFVSYFAPTPGIEEWVSQPLAVSGQLSAVSSPAGPNHPELYCLLSVTWVVGLVLLGIRWLRSSHRLARLVSQSENATDSELLSAFERAKQALRLKRPVRLAVCSSMGTPAACRILRPVVLVPSGMARALDEAELEAVLLHELVHIKRFDNLTAAFHRMLCSFFWFHPLIWLLDRKLLSERESSCDQVVVAHGGEPRAYAAGILKICRFSFTASPVGVSLTSGSSLGRRIRMITGQRPQRTRWSHRLVLAALVCGLVFVSVAFMQPDSSRAAQSGSGQELKLGTCPGCPITLLSARLKAEGTAGQAPAIRIRNDGNRAVKHFYLVLENPDVSQKAYFRVSEPLQPGEEKTLEIRAQRAGMAVEEGPNRYRLETVGTDEAQRRLGDPSRVEAKVPTVVFADDTSFALKGYLPPPPPAAPAPPAPPPPAPPAPPAPPPGWEDDEPIMGGVVGGVPGGVKGGVPGGVKGGVPGGVKGGVPGGVKKRTPKPAPAPKPKPTPAPGE